jgi:hypothetical protein
MVRRRFAWTGSDWRPSAGTRGSDCTLAHRRRCQRTGVTRATPCVERRALVNTTTNRGRLAERFEEPAVYAGFAILDPEGRKIGVVRELFANGRDEPEYVRAGGAGRRAPDDNAAVGRGAFGGEAAGPRAPGTTTQTLTGGNLDRQGGGLLDPEGRVDHHREGRAVVDRQSSFAAEARTKSCSSSAASPEC